MSPPGRQGSDAFVSRPLGQPLTTAPLGRWWLGGGGGGGVSTREKGDRCLRLPPSGSACHHCTTRAVVVVVVVVSPPERKGTDAFVSHPLGQPVTTAPLERWWWWWWWWWCLHQRERGPMPSSPTLWVSLSPLHH